METVSGLLLFAMGVVVGAVLGGGIAFVWTSRLYLRLTRGARDD